MKKKALCLLTVLLLLLTVLPSAAAEDGTVNLALGKTMTAGRSSSSNPPEYANDGDTGTRWQFPSNKTDNRYIYVDLEAEYEITELYFLFWNQGKIQSYTVASSLDGDEWTDQFTQEVPTDGSAPNSYRHTLDSTQQFRARYIRWYGGNATNGDNYGLYEFEVYGTEAQEETPETPIVSNVAISEDSPKVGMTLHGTYTYSNPDDVEGNNDVSAYQWERSEDNDKFVAIDGAGESEYTVQSVDEGQYIRLTVTPRTNAASGVIQGTPVSSISVGPVTAAMQPIVEDVHILGKNNDQTDEEKTNNNIPEAIWNKATPLSYLTAAYTFQDTGETGGTEQSTVRWLSDTSEDGSFTAEIGKGKTYQVKVADKGTFIKCEVTPVDSTGVAGEPVLSDPVQVVDNLVLGAKALADQKQTDSSGRGIHAAFDENTGTDWRPSGGKNGNVVVDFGQEKTLDEITLNYTNLNAYSKITVKAGSGILDEWGGSYGATNWDSLTWATVVERTAEDGEFTSPLTFSLESPVTTRYLMINIEISTSQIKVFEIGVYYRDAEDIVDPLIAAVEEFTLADYFPGVDLNAVTEDLKPLPSSIEVEGIGTVEINWTSSDTATLENDGTVHRPTSDEESKEVKMTATFRPGNNPITKDFFVTVLKEAEAGQPYVPEITQVTVTGAPVLGATITGAYTYVNPDDADKALDISEYAWQTSVDGQAFADISGANQETYVLEESDIGLYVRLKVTPITNYANGAVTGTAAYSDPIGPVTDRLAPKVENVVILGKNNDQTEEQKTTNNIPEVQWYKATANSTLTASYTFVDPSGMSSEGSSVIKWYISSSADSGYSELGEGETYQIQPRDVGFYIKYAVTPVDANGTQGEPVESKPVLIVENILAGAKALADQKQTDSAGRGIHSAFDENTSTDWRPSGGKNANVVVDLCQEKTFNTMTFNFANQADYGSLTIKVASGELSEWGGSYGATNWDELSWTTVLEKTTFSASETITFDTNVSGRYIMFNFVLGNTNSQIKVLDMSASYVNADAAMLEELLEKAVSSFELETYLPNLDMTAVTEDLVGLPTSIEIEGLGTVQIKWLSSNPEVIDDDGTVTRPAADTQNATVRYTAQFETADFRKAKTFTLTVLKEFTDQEAVDADTEALEITPAYPEFDLPLAGENGTTIVWRSSNSSIIQVDSGKAKVALPSSTTVVTLTATITKGEYKKEKKFNVTEQGTNGGAGGGSSSRPVNVHNSYSGSTVEVPPTTTNPLSPIPETGGDTNGPFADIKGHWAENYILDLYDRGIVSGVSENSFDPERSVTRGEYVKMLVEAFQIPLETAETSFTDVSPDAWYAPYLAAAKQVGIIQGDPDGAFRAGETITREDIAVLTSRIVDYSKISLQEKTVKNSFIDQDQISGYAAYSVERLQRAGILNGTEDGYFHAKNAATRAEAAKIISTLLYEVE